VGGVEVADVRVLVVNTNRHGMPSPAMPLGACLVAEAAAHAGHRVRLLDLMFEPRPRQALARALQTETADVVGFSVRNIDDNNMAAPQGLLGHLRPLVDVARTHSEASLGLGGAAVGIMPREVLELSGAHWAVAGEGERVFPQLLDAVAGGRDPRTVAGVVTPGDAAVEPLRAAHAPETFAADLHRWIDVRAYEAHLAPAPVQSKRGCPFECVYCTYPLIEGRAYRLAEPEHVVDAVRRLKRQGTRDAEFVDNVFNEPREHALAVCEALARAHVGMRLHSVDMSPRGLDVHLLRAMEQAGFASLGITVESASDPALAGLGKAFTAEDVRSAAEAVRHTRLPCLWSLLLGGPGETTDSVEETMRFVRDDVRPGDTVFLSAGLRVYPGTRLARIARDQGVLTVPAGGMLRPVFYVSPELDREWLYRVVRRASASYANIAGSRAAALSFLPALNRWAYRLGVRPPLWRHTRRLRRVLNFLGIRT